MRYHISICFLVVYLLSPASYADNLSSKIDALIDKSLPHATVGVLVKNAQTDEIIYSRNADKLLTPASGTKLFTAAAALYQLKPNYSFLTSLSQKNNDFYITFSGSPSFTIANLNDLILNLKNSSYKTIGNIILDSTRFKPPYYAGGDSYDDLGWYYTAPSTAVILNGNAASYDFISPPKLGMPVEIKPKTSDNGLNIINQVITVDKKQEKEHCNLNIDIKSKNTLKLFGCFAANKEPKLMQLAVTDPILLAQQIIKKSIETNGISIQGSILNGETPSDATVIASFQSGNLTKLITHMLRESDNLYANSLYKQLGYSVTGEGTFKQGAFAIKKILTEHTHMDLKQVELADGAGGRYNLVTPEQVVVLLSDLYQDEKIKPIILDALPQAGLTGSLKARLKETKLEKKVFAKTGTMHDISSLSGYIVDEHAETLIFSIIINGVNTPITTAKTLEEQILLALVDE